MLAANRRSGRAFLAIVVLGGMLLGSRPAPTRADPTVDMNVTLTIYTQAQSLLGFDSSTPSNVFSVYNIYHSLLAKAFPNLHFKEVQVADNATMETKLTLATGAGNAPDLAFIQGGYMGFSVLRKLVQPLDAYYNAYHVSDGYFLPGMARWAHFGGHWWAIPAVSGPLVGQLFYLPKYMNALGYNNDNLRTFDDLYAMSKKAVQFDAAGNLARIGYWPGFSWDTMERLMCPVGHGLYDRSNQPTANDACNVAWLGYLKRLSDLYGGYPKLSRFIAGDPDFWGGSPKSYLATGKALITPSANAYWCSSAFDSYDFGVKGGLQYELTPLPPTVHGTMAEVANDRDTGQLLVIPTGAKHPAAAFAVSRFIAWLNGYLLGPSTNGSPVAADQERWVSSLITGEAALRRKAGLPGNPVANLQGIKMQPQLARMSQGYHAINPVDVYYKEQLKTVTTRVLYGQETPQAALDQLQRMVLAKQQQLKGQYGNWNW